jgi:hypothetical protein
MRQIVIHFEDYFCYRNRRLEHKHSSLLLFILDSSDDIRQFLSVGNYLHCKLTRADYFEALSYAGSFGETEGWTVLL